MAARRHPFAAFEALLTYAIESSSDRERTQHYQELELTPETFCAKLYVRRPELENRILEYITRAPHEVRIEGPAGCGKSSTIHKLLHGLKSELHGLIFIFDFKAIVEIHGRHLEEHEELEHWVNDQLRGEIEQYILTHEVDPATLAVYLLAPECHHRLTPPSKTVRGEIFNRYHRETLDSPDRPHFVLWLSSKLQQRDAFVVDRLDAFLVTLRAEDYLCALVETQKLPENRKAIVFFDNVDSIPSARVRTNLRMFVRKHQHVVQGHTKVIISHRPERPVDWELEKRPADQGAFFFNPIDMDAWEWLPEDKFASEVAQCRARKGYCNPRDEQSIRARLYFQAQRDFDGEILKRRLDYLAARVNAGQVADLDGGALLRFGEFCSGILANRYVSGRASALCNNDRRSMLVHLTNFVLYITESLGLSPDALAGGWEREFVAESYFYSWLVDRGAVFPIDTYNIVRATEAWYSGKGSELGCLERHLIMACIFNLVPALYSKHPLERTTIVRSVIETCEEIGFSRERLLQLLFRLYRDEDDYRGLVETSRYYQVKQPSDIRLDDEITLTPRALHLIQFIGAKFFYLLALMRHERVTMATLGYGTEGQFDYNDRDPITRATLESVLRYVCRIGHMHLVGLAQKRDVMRRADWLARYRSCFCVGSQSPLQDVQSSMMLENMVRSYIRFLERHRQMQDDADRQVVTTEIVREYRAILETFRSRVEALGKGQDVDTNLLGTLRAEVFRAAGDEEVE